MSRVFSIVVCLLLAGSTVFGQTPKKYALLAAVTTYEHTHLNSPPKIQYRTILR